MKCWSGKLPRKFLFLITLGMFLSILAAPAGAAGDEETIAVNFLKFLRSDKEILSAEILEGNRLDPALPPVTVAHLFHLKGGGYLLVSADRSISPVKAYSLVGDFVALPPPYREALLAELELRARVALAGAARAPLEAGMTETEKQWNFLLRLDEMRLPLAYTEDTYLLHTKWNQTYPYNKFLPTVGGQTVVAGCVNVAVAQVMRYHRHPASGKGVIAYDWTPSSPPSPQHPWPSQTLKTILYRPLSWDRMPDAVDAATPEYQADEVALFIRDLGIANQTAFDANGSSTYLHTDVLTNNYGYSNSLASMDNTVYNSFLAKLQAEISEERPLLLTFPGHMTVADGYSSDGTGIKVHVNMGWGGAADDFYFLNPAPDSIIDAGGQTFPTDAGKLDIYYNIKLCSGSADDCVVLSPPAGEDQPPVIGGGDPDRPLPDLLLRTATAVTRKILIDARDENGDPVLLSVRNSNPSAVRAVLNGNLLELTPTGASKVSARIVVAASANGKTAEKAFTVMTDDGETGFGKSFTVGGTFASQGDVETHRAILDGACTITGDNGYSNQGFYSSVSDTSGYVLVPADDVQISRTFDRGLYWLRSSLQQNPGGSGYYYPYKQGDHDQYTLTVKCPDADQTTATFAGILGISLAGANLPIVWPGDVNGDSVVTLADAILVMQMLCGIDMTGNTIILAADVNGDAKISSAEALFILQVVANLRFP